MTPCWNRFATFSRTGASKLKTRYSVSKTLLTKRKQTHTRATENYKPSCNRVKHPNKQLKTDNLAST